MEIYRRVSPSVVLILSDSGLGSGTLLNARGEILTNLHVVSGARQIGVIFKPAQEGRSVTRADVRPATVLRVDEVTDLALVRVAVVPEGIPSVTIGDSASIAVGADVHAIGHPTGEAWTYTMGVISQVRDGYSWAAEDHRQHVADVIQTQTPINPGNSGGPLLADDGTLIGVNSFKAAGEALNFAVGLSEIQRFIASTTSRLSSPTPPSAFSATKECEPREVYRGRRPKDGYNAVGVDLDCDGKVDIEFREPFDAKDPFVAAMDRNHDGRVDLLVFSFSRDWKKWDLSFLDQDYDGEWDLVGYHDTGDFEATRYEPYSAWAKQNKNKTRRGKTAGRSAKSP